MANIDEFPEKIVIGNSEFEFDLNNDVDVNRADLQGEFCKQAELFASYSTAYEFAAAQAAHLKVQLTRLEAHLDHQGRMEAKTGGVKMTETMASNYVKGHADWLSAQEDLLQAQKITGLLKSAKDAMLHKRDMLKELGAHERQERASDISLKANIAKNNY
jgi:hypothetical protein